MDRSEAPETQNSKARDCEDAPQRDFDWGSRHEGVTKWDGGAMGMLSVAASLKRRKGWSHGHRRPREGGHGTGG